MKRTVLYAAALALCITALSACGKGETPQGTTASDATTEPVTEVTSEALGVPTHADYGGETFSILTAGNVAHRDFTFDEQSALPMDSAQYRRRARVEEDYKVKIEQTRMQGDSSGAGPGFMEVSTAVNAGESKWDLALIAGYDVSVLAYNGLLYDLNSVPGIDLTKSWWDQKANESLAMNGVMFFSTGEITTSDNNAAFVIMFNKELMRNYALDDPYQLVYDGKWTMGKFAELCKTVTEDLNQDGKMDENDRFGLLVWVDSVVGIVNAAGQRCCTIEDGEIKLTLYNETTVSALETYFSIAYDTQYAFTYQRGGSGTDYEKRLWEGDHGLFWTTYMGIVPTFREMESDFGLLPYPKLTETQDAYYSTVAPFNSQFICVPLVQDDIERTGTITEALAYYGKEIVTPVYYDVNLIGQSTRDEESADMLDIIFNSFVFDIGYYYQIGPYNKELIYMVRAYDTNFASRYDAKVRTAETLLGVINEYYKDAVAKWKTE